MRGRAAEDAGDPTGALELYARALAALGAERPSVDTGAILHHVGNCSSRLGDVESAWEAHLAAARLIHGYHGLGDLGAALGEAGLLLTGFRPRVPIREAITHELLLDALADALDHASDALLGVALPTEGTATIIHRKLTGLMLLASGAAADVILSQGALSLYHRVALPFAERRDVRWAKVDDPKIIAFTFDALARLYEAIGEQERSRRVAEPPTFEEVRSLVCLATDAFVGAPHSPISGWLGPYLRERRGATWATDEVLADIRCTA